MNTWLEDIVKANVWSKPKHKGSLSHVGTDHSAGTYDGQLLISQILHNKMYYLFIRFFQFHKSADLLSFGTNSKVCHSPGGCKPHVLFSYTKPLSIPRKGNNFG